VKELQKRVVSGLFLGPLILLLFYFLPAQGLFLLTVIVGLFAIAEFAKMAGLGQRHLILFLAIICMVPLYLKSLEGYFLCVIFSPALYFIIQFLRGEGKKEDANTTISRDISCLVLCEVLIIFPLYCIYLLKIKGDYLLLILLFAIWASDTCAYFIGKNFGKRLLVPKISPKKTCEGLLGAIIGSTTITLLSMRVMGVGILEAIIIGVAIGILGQVGDIMESVAKRVYGTKDSSALIPGHGGILDRMDSFIFTAPFLYYYLSGIKI
jgi:phosphatidate cytidylyltransferase